MLPVKSGKLYALIGRSRSGKTVKAMDLISAHRCVLIWDVEGQYKATSRAHNPRQLIDLISKNAGKKSVIAYTGKLSDFAFFCSAAFWYVRKCCELGQHCAVVIEETADVTSPAKAPENYGVLIRRGLKYGADLIAVTQRPAESDKTTIGNASIIHVCALRLPRDRDYVATMTGVPVDVIRELRADQDSGRFDYVTVDDNSMSYDMGRLSFVGNHPKFTKTKTAIPL